MIHMNIARSWLQPFINSHFRFGTCLFELFKFFSRHFWSEADFGKQAIAQCLCNRICLHNVEVEFRQVLVYRASTGFRKQID